MYGSIFRMKPKAGQKQAIFDEMDRWGKERAPKVKGFVASYVLEAANGDVIGAAVFADEETYRANANDPEQDKWFQGMRGNLEADPEWNDGAIRVWNAS